MFEFSGIKTAMIGSMPHKDAETAFSILNQYPLSIPSWPQLPSISYKEGMLNQYCEGFPGFQIDDTTKKAWVGNDEGLLTTIPDFYENVFSANLDAFSISPEFSHGFNFFLSALKQNSQKIAVVKTQVTGPFTLGLGLADQNLKALWFDEQYKDIILKGLIHKALWQIRELKKVANEVIIFFDEPILSALGTPAYMGISDENVIDGLNEIIDAIHETDVSVGTHCCGNMDWSLLARTNLDFIAFDAFEFGEKVALYPKEINTFLERGGTLAWGIIPTNKPEDLRKSTFESLQLRIEDLIAHFSKKGISEALIRKQMLITPACGFGSLSVEDGDLVLKRLHQFSDS